MNTQEKEQLFREAFAQIERIETALDEMEAQLAEHLPPQQFLEAA